MGLRKVASRDRITLKFLSPPISISSNAQNNTGENALIILIVLFVMSSLTNGCTFLFLHCNFKAYIAIAALIVKRFFAFWNPYCLVTY